MAQDTVIEATAYVYQERRGSKYRITITGANGGCVFDLTFPRQSIPMLVADAVGGLTISDDAYLYVKWPQRLRRHDEAFDALVVVGIGVVTAFDALRNVRAANVIDARCIYSDFRESLVTIREAEILFHIPILHEDVLDLWCDILGQPFEKPP